MLFHNIRTALQNILRFKSHTIIGLTGLAISLACLFVITAWAIQELQYDRFHNAPGSVFMVTTEMSSKNGNNVIIAETPPALANELKRRIPSLEQSLDLIYLYGKRILQSGDNSYEETGVAADPRMLEVFNFPIIEGNSNLLDDPNSIFITEKLGKKLFADEAPIGKVIGYNNDRVLTVRGILKDIPENSSLKFDFIVAKQIESDSNSSWWPLSTNTFIKIAPKASLADISDLANTIWRENIEYEQFTINLVPITKLRYGSDFEVFNAKHGNYLKLYSFIGIAILILILASLNYVNLVSAYLFKSRGDLGIRKINGATSKNIFSYILIESVIILLIASLMAVLLSAIFIRLFQYLADVNIVAKYLVISSISGSIAAIIIIGIISVLYPALVTSLHSPFSKKHTNNSLSYKARLKNAFVISQFILSITLTTASLILIRQTNYLNKFDLGYNSQNIVQIFLPTEGAGNFETIKSSLLSDPNISQVSFARISPVDVSSFFLSEGWSWEGLQDESSTSIYSLSVDNSYLDIFRIPFLSGRNFVATESDNDKVIINEQLSHMLGFGDPIGKLLNQGDNTFEIIGVVKDFHFQNLSNSIKPQLFTYSASQNRMFVEINQNTEQGLNAIKEQFDRFFNVPFSYSFIDKQIKGLYANESKISLGIIVFTVLTIILSCIGLIGLLTFNLELKVKEIGIRKVCGSTVTEVIVLLNRDIIKWFLVGAFISCCISWYAMTKWLENFSFRVSLDWWLFFAGAFIIFAITALSATWLTWKAARQNPIRSINSY